MLFLDYAKETKKEKFIKNEMSFFKNLKIGKIDSNTIIKILQLNKNIHLNLKKFC